MGLRKKKNILLRNNKPKDFIEFVPLSSNFVHHLKFIFKIHKFNGFYFEILTDKIATATVNFILASLALN